MSAALKFRSIYSASIDSAESQCNFPDAPPQSKSKSWKVVESVPEAAAENSDGTKNDDSFDDHKEDKSDVKEYRGDPIKLPESTHSLFFVASFCSLPSLFAWGIAALSVGCLILALINALDGGTALNPFNIPVNISSSTRGAQYLSIFVVLLMEEEIPTGLAQMRLITFGGLRSVCPKASYKKFLAANIFRVLMGYLFLVNVLLVLIQAEDVLTIFYDVLALQFVQQLDDIGFRLARLDVFGRRMQRACTMRWFDAEFEYHKGCAKHKMMLKSIYFINMFLFIAAIVVVSTRQMNGYYFCKELTLDVGDGILEEAFVKNAKGSFDTWVLAYSYFNGVFLKNGTHAGRPVYKEARKFDRQPYPPPEDQGGSMFQAVVPAEIKYCEDIKAWVLTHKNIGKSEDDDYDSSCNWLLRSPETDSFNVLDASGKWDMWVGVLGTTDVSITCNRCADRSDCNLNGECSDDGRCICNNGNGVNYFGEHCEVKLRDECKTIIPEDGNYNMSIEHISSWSNSNEVAANEGSDSNYVVWDDIWQEYSRPVFSSIDNDERWSLIYSGSRWFGMNLTGTNVASKQWRTAVSNYHAFWYRAYENTTTFVSDPTKESSPVGVDWYQIGERGDQFGPLGALTPVQRYNQTGRGLFRCGGNMNKKNTVSSRHLSTYDRKLTTILKGHVRP
mmetsp:Transcript_27195/g.46217  ORF Transcript_27195/g.46217 Transcript_27195/m.46217 type:complete len:673 (+) Transcript_27195:113-2131(+)